MVALIILVLMLLALPLLHRLPIKVSIGQLFALGAIAMIACGGISMTDAYRSINLTVMVYLIGVFLLAQALEQSHYLSVLACRLLVVVQSGYHLLALLIFLMGVSSAFLMNDTVAIIGAPLVIALCRHRHDLAQVLLLALAYSVTIGGVMSPIGSPQNLLIALNLPKENAFSIFLSHLGVPTILNLILLYCFIAIIFRRVLAKPLQWPEMLVSLRDPRLASLSQSGLIIFFLLLLIKVLLDSFGYADHLSFDRIAILSALPVVLLSPQRWRVIRNLDWDTLLFFVALFVVAQGMWQGQMLQRMIDYWHWPIGHSSVIVGLSLLGSQLISNVPWVALYLSMLNHLGAPVVAYLALAVGSTLAGNLFIIGAASNVIVMQKAKKHGLLLSVGQFSMIGVPLSLFNLLLYMIFLK